MAMKSPLFLYFLMKAMSVAILTLDILYIQEENSLILVAS